MADAKEWPNERCRRDAAVGTVLLACGLTVPKIRRFSFKFQDATEPAR